MKAGPITALARVLPFVLPASVLVQEPVPGPPAVEDAELGRTSNVHRAGELWLAGQFGAEDVALLRERGIRRVITTRREGEVSWDEQAAVEAAGMEWVAVPFREPESLTDEVFGRIRELLAGGGTPTLLHCGSANRVGGAWLPFRVLDQGVPLEQALAEARTIGLGSEAYRSRAIDYIAREEARRAMAREDARGAQADKLLPPGLNDPYKDPELDVQSFIERFEVESREVYAAREAILAALQVKPGAVVADIGAGTGLFSLPIARAAGPDGWLFAVDIAPRFLQHIQARAAEAGVENLSPLLASDSSCAVPAGAIDLAFVCDTYHHFEQPAATLASIRRALKPGGRLVVVDFERIVGTTRDWILEHVRAGKETFRAEIEAAGFELAREVEVEGLEENYFLEFRRPPL